MTCLINCKISDLIWFGLFLIQSGAKGKQSVTQKDSSSAEVKPKKVANAEELKYVNPNADTVQGKLEKKKVRLQTTFIFDLRFSFLLILLLQI